MHRIRLAFLMTPLLIAVLAAGLGSCSTPSGGPPDGGTDAGGDAGDAGDAADHPDIGDAVAEPYGEAGWVPVSWKAACEVEVAQHPEFAVPKLTWEPCPVLLCKVLDDQVQRLKPDSTDILRPAVISSTGDDDRLRMHCLLAYVTARFTRGGISFTWKGAWEYDQVSGTGRMRILSSRARRRAQLC